MYNLFWKIFCAFDRLKVHFLNQSVQNKLGYCGINTFFDLNTEIHCPSNIKVGDNVYVGKGTILVGYGGLTINDGVIIGAGCKITTRNHIIDRNVGYRFSGYNESSVRIGSNVWLGYNVVILPGVCISEDSVVAAGAVVTKDVPAGQIWGGVPAKFIRYI